MLILKHKEYNNLENISNIVKADTEVIKNKKVILRVKF